MVWNLSKPHRPGGLKSAMARDNMPFGISKDRIGEAERFNGRADLIDLALRMGTGIARIGNELADRAVSNGQPRGQASRYWFVHDRGTDVMMSDRSLLAAVLLVENCIIRGNQRSLARRCAAQQP
jgi:hypothetical protein